LLNTIGAFDKRVLQDLQVDVRRVYLRPPSTFTLSNDDNGYFHDEWGVGYLPVGPYNERVGHPLAEATIDDLDSFAWPDPDDPGRVEGLRDEAQRLYETTDYCLSAGHISAGIFQDCWNLRGMERFMQDLALNRTFAEALLARVTDIHCRIWGNFLAAVGEFVDMVETADDLGGQSGMLISPHMYRDMIKPCHAVLNTTIRCQTDARILYHSCGAIMPVIDDLIEVGVNVLNPIQPLPGLMDPLDLRERFGDRLVFHGGLDVQTLLPTGRPADVEAHVKRYLETLGPDRYIMAPANSIQPGTPPENIVRAYDTARTY
jgi:uroporphyrinogen decarboxylase